MPNPKNHPAIAEAQMKLDLAVNAAIRENLDNLRGALGADPKIDDMAKVVATVLLRAHVRLLRACIDERELRLVDLSCEYFTNAAVAMGIAMLVRDATLQAEAEGKTRQ